MLATASRSSGSSWAASQVVTIPSADAVMERMSTDWLRSAIAMRVEEQGPHVACCMLTFVEEREDNLNVSSSREGRRVGRRLLIRVDTIGPGTSRAPPSPASCSYICPLAHSGYGDDAGPHESIRRD